MKDEAVNSKAAKKNRRVLRWDQVRGLKKISSLLIATALGAGLLPLAPGSWGTLMGIPLVLALEDQSQGIRLVFWVILFIIGTWASKVFDQMMGSQDNQNIVIDEVVGYGVTAWTIDANWKSILVAFFVFRFFDMVKPPPVRQIDRWSHSHSLKLSPEGAAWLTGFGVMADDLLAGLMGLVVMILLQAARIL